MTGITVTRYLTPKPSTSPRLIGPLRPAAPSDGDMEYHVPGTQKTIFLHAADSPIPPASAGAGQRSGWTVPWFALPGAKVREMIGAGVPVAQPNVRNGKSTTSSLAPPCQSWRRGNGPVAFKPRRTAHYSNPSVVESGHKTRQPRAGHPFPLPPPGSHQAGRDRGASRP